MLEGVLYFFGVSRDQRALCAKSSLVCAGERQRTAWLS
jgi:hypothetical protein